MFVWKTKTKCQEAENSRKSSEPSPLVTAFAVKLFSDWVAVFIAKYTKKRRFYELFEFLLSIFVWRLIRHYLWRAKKPRLLQGVPYGLLII